MKNNLNKHLEGNAERYLINSTNCALKGCT
jgi:hypothetical protein